MKKKAAMELSIGTIVVIVIAMLTLILGIVLVKSIFTGSNQNINDLNQKVKDKIRDLFVDENTKTMVYLTNKKVEIKKGKEWGVAFAVKNTNHGTTSASEFSYVVNVSDPYVEKKCGVSAQEIKEKWIRTGRSSRMVVRPGDVGFGLVRIRVPEDSALCIVRFTIDFSENNKLYATDFFDVEVKP